MKYISIMMLSFMLLGCGERIVVSGDCYSWIDEAGSVVPECYRTRREAVEGLKEHFAQLENTKPWQERNWKKDDGGY